MIPKVERASTYLPVEDDPNHAKIIEPCLRQGGLPVPIYHRVNALCVTVRGVADILIGGSAAAKDP